MLAITTKYHAPTNYRGARVSATDAITRARVYVPYDYACNPQGAHKQAFFALLEKENYSAEFAHEFAIGESMHGYVFVSTYNKFEVKK